MDPVVSTTTESALQIAGRVVKRQVGYFFNYNDKFEEVKRHIVMLDNAMKRRQNEVEVAERNGEEIEDDVQHWLKQVDEKIKKYEEFIRDNRHAKTRCSAGFFPYNLQLRYRLGRKATKMIEEIKADGHSNKNFDSVSFRVSPCIDAALANPGYESFGSRKKTLEMIMKALEDSTVNMIGVFGVGGVGKTTFVKEVAKKAQEKKLFNIVVLANITRNPDIKKIQGQIAEMLGLRLEEESEILRADRIQKRLKKEKENTLIILDDIWDGLDLNRLGIPYSDDDDGSGSQQDVKDTSDFGYNKIDKEEFSADFSKMKKEEFSADFNKMKKDELSADFNMKKKETSGVHNRCKILLISRIKEVICQMDVQERSTFEVQVIDEKEAEILLKKAAGIHVTNSVFDGKAIEIAKMCARLPIALVSIGKALKNKSSFVWEDVCQQLNRQNFTEGQESIEFSVKLSYDHLKNELLKNIFLHCARMGNDALIIDLVKFCIGMGLLRGVQTFREARNKVNVLIEELRELSLLIGSYSFDRFNMHDIVRDVALSISLKEKHVLFMKNGILDEWPHKDELEKYNAIYLHNCDINDGLPERMYCPRLEVLHIDSKNDILQIPDDFFKDMIELRVLVLTGVDLSCLPSSIKCLKKLRMLSLERCTLGKDLPIIGELKKLRILTLSGSNIESLPLDFGKLDKLQLFDLSNCSKLRIIPSNIISMMKSLEEFYMRDELIQREAEEKIQSGNAILSELRHLNQLSTLDIHVPSIAHFPQNLFFDRLDSYKIVIGEFNMLSVGEFKIPDKYEVAKFLALNLKDGVNIHSEKWIKLLFKRVEYLLLGELNGVHDVFNELNVEGFPNLKHLSIVNNFGIHYIINSKELFHPILAFPKLESLCLYKLENLEKICDNKFTEDSFSELKIIKIKTCGQLENVFSLSMLRRLTKLETIEVCDCDSLKEIISMFTVSDVQADKIEFPQLRFLTLQSLPLLFCLYTNNKMPSISQSLEDQVPNKELKEITTLTGQDTDACVSLFNGKVSFPNLEWMELSSINIPQIWNDQSLDCFQKLLTLNVSDCSNLKYLLSCSMARSLVNLQSLSVSGCESMEDIFSAEDSMHNFDIFLKLKKMEINCMENLNTICQPHIGFHSFQNLDSLIIRKCNKLVTIFPSYMGQGFQNLQSLVIIACQSVETVFDFRNIPQTDGRNEINLHDVFLKGLPKLLHVWKVDTGGVLKFNNLHSIVVYESKMLEYLFPLSVANGLENLETLDVCNCWGMKEIVAWDNGSNEEVVMFRLPKLNTLSLQHLYELRNFYQGKHTLQWPLLKKLSILACSKLEETTNSQVKPIFIATEKVIHNLEYMSISLKEAKWLQDYIVSVHIRMHKLQSLVMFGLKNTEILFWFLHRLPNLESITLKNCLFEGVWDTTRLISHEKIGAVLQLKELIFNNVWYLQNIGFEHDLLLQRVERLVISGSLKLRSLLPSSVSFGYLTYLEATDCPGLRNLMTSSTAKTLVQLTTMRISHCQRIVKIIAEEEETQVIEFRQLKAIELVSLQSLTCFCSSEKCDLKFPSLENLVVSDCPLMETFSKSQSAPNLRKIHIAAGEKERWYWEGDLNATLKNISSDKVPYEHSKRLELREDSKLEEILLSKAAFTDNYFHSLKTLVVKDITKDHLIPSQILPCLKSLEELRVVSCGAMEVIFDIDDIVTMKTKEIVSHLKKLTLDQLPNLKCVWNKNPQGIVNFINLQEVTVNYCGHLTTLFPLSLARTLVKLKTLEIQGCVNLVEIVGKEDAMEHGTTEVLFEFPCLSLVLLYKLPLLSCFYPGKHHLECPRLEILHVPNCPKLKVFTSEFHESHEEVVIEAAISRLQEPLFLVEKVVPKLKELTLNEENIILLSNAQLPQHLLCKLNLLSLCFEDNDNNNKKDTLPFHLLHKVLSSEHLVVNRCFGLKEIFPSQKLQVLDEILAKLKTLELFLLEELESIGLEHPWVKPYSEKLEILILHHCSRLEKVVCCAVSFISLKKVIVINCERMEYLFTFSTAKSLEQLEILDIKWCESMKEIVKKEDEDDSDEIIFGRLTALVLDSLPSLASFYSGKATLQFSCLQVVTVATCPNMKTFSEGVINVPKIFLIQTLMGESDILFEFHDDLNATIERLLHQQAFLEYTKHMILVDYLEMTGIRHGKPAFSDNFFGNFKKLEFDATNKRETVIPSHVLPHLKNLKELKVQSCKSARVIFDADDSEANTKGLVSRLKKLTLYELPNLKCVWNKSPRGIVSFPNLQEVFVTNCGSLETLFPEYLARNLVKLKTLQILTCDELVVIVGKEDATEPRTSEMFEFPFLSKLILYELPLLSCFYPGKYLLECPILENLKVACCPKLKLFTSEFHESRKESVIEAPVCQLQQPLFLVEKVVPNLKALALNEENISLLSDAHLPQHLLCKINILDLCFEDDVSKKDTLPFDFLHKVPNLELLQVSLKEIFSSQKPQVHDRIFDRLKYLTPTNLQGLESTGLEHPWVKPYSEKLQKLSLQPCFRLEKLAYSVVSFINLRELDVSCCKSTEYSFTFSTAKSCSSLKEIFPSQKPQVHDRIFARLKYLTLTNLQGLESTGLEHPWVKPYSEKLQKLSLQSCSRLEKLVCSVVSFINLRELDVSCCKSMEYLFTFSTAKSLVQLEILHLKDCESLKEIIQKEDEDASEEIILGRLTTLTLKFLPRLVRFYSGNATLQLLCLKTATVAKCPNMYTFSEGGIDAPMFSGIKTSTEESDVFEFYNDLNTTVERLFHQQGFFEYSKHMILVNYLEMAGFRLDKPSFSGNFFGSFKKLEFDAASKQDIVIPSHVLRYFRSLEELKVVSCKSVRVIFDIKDSEANTKGLIVSHLKTLTLEELPNLKCVWNKNPHGIVSFPNLQQVVVKGCVSLVTLFHKSLARNLVNLQTLHMERCFKFVGIVGKEDAMEPGTTEMFEFPCLYKLILLFMPVLSCFYPGKHNLECPILECLIVGYCPKLKLFTSKFHGSHKEAVIEAQMTRPQQPLFSVEKVGSKLKKLALNEENIILLTEGHLPQDFLCKLKLLELFFEDDDTEKDTLPFDFLSKLPILENLSVFTSYGLKEIFPSQVPKGILATLKHLGLYYLRELESIGLEHPWVKPCSEKLESLNLTDCSRLEKIVCSAVSFTNLKELGVTDCERMEYLFTFSTAKSLMHLERLAIQNCELIKEIVKSEDEDAFHEIIFGCLTTLTLHTLQRVVSFYSGNATLQFSCLKKVMVAKCPNMKTFSQGVVNAPMFYGIQTSMEDSDLIFHDDLNTTIKRLFHEQVFMEYSKHNQLINYPEMKEVNWHGKSAFPDLFGCIKKLDIDAESGRDIVIPSSVLPYLKSLEELNVDSCNAVQEIFEIDDSETKTKEIVFNLKRLTLKALPNLKCVWNKNPQGIVSFPNLGEVVVNDCARLATLFPSSIARNLVNLKTLEILRCDNLVEIVGKEDAMEDGTTEILFEFPVLSELILAVMPLLSCFYPGKHYVECPLLEILHVAYCPKLKLFISELRDSHKEAVIETPISQLQQPLFLIEKVVPKLKKLALNEENIILLSDGHLPQDLLCKLKFLALCFEDVNNEKDALPFDFLHKVPSLEHLVVNECYGLKEIFPSQKLQVHDKILARLNSLTLSCLRELESIGLEHPWVKPYSEKLEILYLQSCSQLKMIVFGAASFINLIELDVTDCERMEYLFTFSTAKSLVQLVILSIQNCVSLKEIVKKEDEDASHEIMFGRLTTLTLYSLPRLVRFYSGNATLQLSHFQEATVAKCPNMKSFSEEGGINAPLFYGIKTSKEDSNNLAFHDDLNTTIKRLFQQEVEKSACDMYYLKFGDHLPLEEIWLGVVPIPSTNCFKNLISLIVVECESLSNVIPFYLLPFLCNLKEIHVSNCQSVKAIFDGKGRGADMKPASRISLPLKKLILNQLPNLEHIWNLNSDEILSLQDLQEVGIYNCQSLKSLFTTSMANHLVMLDVRYCERLVEIFVEYEATLKGATKQFIFHCLASLTLWELPELKYFYNGKHSLEWPMLTHLDMYHCDKLKLFTTEHHIGEAIEDQLGISNDQQVIFFEKMFPDIEQLSLRKEDAMAISRGLFQAKTNSKIVIPNMEHQAITEEGTMVGQGQFGANAAHLLRNLKVIRLQCYHEDDESNIFSSGILEKIPSIENLEVVCSSLNELFSSQKPSVDCTKILSKLKGLHLYGHYKLSSIGLEHSWVEPLLKRLKTLDVNFCPFLKILVPSSVSFSNLAYLNVEQCHGLVCLFNSSTARSLCHLKHLSIKDCQAIQEIVSKEGDQETNNEDEITFGQLNALYLLSLPSIVGFHTGTSKFIFPLLDQVDLMDCPQMKYFYEHDLCQFISLS